MEGAVEAFDALGVVEAQAERLAEPLDGVGDAEGFGDGGAWGEAWYGAFEAVGVGEVHEALEGDFLRAGVGDDLLDEEVGGAEAAGEDGEVDTREVYIEGELFAEAVGAIGVEGDEEVETFGAADFVAGEA